MRAAIYARLSREDEDKIDGNKESRSVENQITLLTEIALQNKFDVVKVYYDDGYTGSNLDRPGFMQMMSDAENKMLRLNKIATL